MILTDREIRIAIKQKQIVIDPEPTDEAFASTSVDLTLSNKVLVFKGSTTGGEAIDPGVPGYDYKALQPTLMDEVDIEQSTFNLNRGLLLLGWTSEHVDLKILSRLAARVEGKSSLARIGLGVHITAPTIHAGFAGTIQLEMINHGPLPIRLRKGMRICQLIFETTLGVPEKGYSGQFAGQTTELKANVAAKPQRAKRVSSTRKKASQRRR